MPRWMCGHTRKDRIRNKVISDRGGGTSIEGKLVQHKLRWFGHIQQKSPDAPVNSEFLKDRRNTRRDGGDRSWQDRGGKKGPEGLECT